MLLQITVTLLLFHISLQSTTSDDIKLVEGFVGQKYDGTVNQNSQMVYKYNINPKAINNTDDSLLRVEVSTEESIIPMKCPTHFVIRNNNHVNVLKVPQEHLAANAPLYSGARTLCVSPDEWLEPFQIYITVSTCNAANVSFSVLVSIKDGYLVTLNESIVTDNVSSTASVFYRFQFPEDENIQTVTVLANSTTKSPTFLSIQPLQCPVRDTRANIKFSGRWHSMSRVTSLVVERHDFPDGFFVAFLPDETLQYDSHSCDLSEHTKSPDYCNPKGETITFKVVYKESNLVLAFAIPPIIYIIGIILAFIGYSYSHQLYIRGNRKDPAAEWSPSQICCTKNIQNTPLRVDNLVSDKNVYRYLHENSYRYFWTMLIVTVFFVVPLSVLIHNLFEVLERTGELDTCNFNYFCSHQFWHLVSFNNVFSTIGFLLLGFAFVTFVHKRATTLIIQTDVNQIRPNNPLDPGWSFRRLWRFSPVELSPTEYGAYQNFGIYYTLGFAMVMAGILKSLYNACPNRDTAFFGTSFMFVIVLLSQIKIYNLRHPSMVNENFTFGTIAIVITTVIIGYLVQSTTFQVVVLVLTSVCIQATILILASAGHAKRRVRMTSNGRVTYGAINEAGAEPSTSINCQAPVDEGNSIHSEVITTPKSIFIHIFCNWNIYDLCFPATAQRVFWPLFRLVVNISILWFICVILNKKHFTFRIYILFLTNFLVDFFYYFVFMKCYLHEYKYKISWQPFLYLILASIFWILATYYLFVSIVDWELPSILFQENYKECVLFGFYDVWDMYQLTVAPALFFTFMVMLTADDALSRLPCNMTNLF